MTRQKWTPAVGNQLPLAVQRTGYLREFWVVQDDTVSSDSHIEIHDLGGLLVILAKHN